jgi:hypothetical protein
MGSSALRGDAPRPQRREIVRHSDIVDRVDSREAGVPLECELDGAILCSVRAPKSVASSRRLGGRSTIVNSVPSGNCSIVSARSTCWSPKR